MTVKEFYQYCEERKLTEHKMRHNVVTDRYGGEHEKDIEECDIEEYPGEIFITDHSRD